jgi:hypothetical protein
MGEFNVTTTMFRLKEHGYAPNIRKYVLHKRKNNNGKGILDFAVTRSMHDSQ